MKIWNDRHGRTLVEMVLVVAALMVIALLVSTQTPEPKAAFVARAETLTPTPPPTPPVTQREPQGVVQTPQPVQPAVQAKPAPQNVNLGTIGTMTGYALPGGNCVDEARAWGRVQPGNPISWRVTSRTPTVGSAMLFSYNHVAIVVGIDWNRGVVIVRHRNCPGCPWVYPIHSARGYA